MNDEHFEQWQELESDLGSHIGLEVQIDTESQLAKDWIEDFNDEGSYASYNLKWILIYHFQEHGLKALLNDYQEIEPLTEFNIR
jgi:hypothetical protein